MLKIINLFKIPIHFIQLFSGAKSFEKNLFIGNKFLNKKGLHIWRVSISQKFAKMRRRSLSHLITKKECEEYEENGFVRIDNFLDEQTFNNLLNEIHNNDFEREDMHQGVAITRRSMIDDIDLKFCPALKEARDDKRMINLIRYISSHYGQPLTTLQTVLSKRSDSKKMDPQTQLHSDTFHPTAKAWLFLIDVGEEDGPFSYVVGSHKVTSHRYTWEKEISTSFDKEDSIYAKRGSLRIKNDELEKLGYPQPTSMCVKANTLIVADTHGFHSRCVSNKSTTRIEIYSSLRRNPFLPFVVSSFGGLHIASLPFIKKRLNRNVIDSLKLLKKWGIKGNPWRNIGYGKADEWTIDNK